MAETQTIKKKPNKFNEIFSTSNNFLGPARGENPFVRNPIHRDETPVKSVTREEAQPSRSAKQ
jgi:hypothetical protein